MDPGAFEAEDIEKELVDAGIESETKNAVEFDNGDRSTNPLEDAAGAEVDGVSHSSTTTLRKSNDFNGIPPRVMSEDIECQAAPTYGRHGKGGQGLEQHASTGVSYLRSQSIKPCTYT